MPRKPAPRRRQAASPKKRSKPLLERSDVRALLFEVANRIAPADVATLMAHETGLRAQAAHITSAHLALLRRQLDLALDCLHDHVRGDCPQIPYYTISLLAAAVHYFADKLDVVPDFLPRIGRLDDAAVMAMACQLTADGLRRYCDWKGRSADAVLGPAPARSAT
jgi:uncharacterized membrane protein YkvA (DUF1232 family)